MELAGNAGGNTAGSAVMLVNDSTINATTVYIGAAGYLAGSGGTINANVVNAGVINPGNSPGMMTINGGQQSATGGQLILEIQANGGGYDIDKLVFMQGSSYDFSNMTVVFSFLGSTDPNAFGASGGMGLDNFLKSSDGANVAGLSSTFAAGQTWGNLLAPEQFSATSTAYDVASLKFDGDTGGFVITDTPVPEPSTWALMLLGLAGVARLARRAQPLPA